MKKYYNLIGGELEDFLRVVEKELYEFQNLGGFWGSTRKASFYRDSNIPEFQDFLKKAENTIVYVHDIENYGKIKKFNCSNYRGNWNPRY